MSENKIGEMIVLQKSNAGKTQIILEGKIDIPDKDLKVVLQTTANSTITSCEVLDGVINIVGLTRLCVVYSNDSGEFKSAELISNFSDKINNELINAGDFAICQCEIVDSDISSVNESEIKIACVSDVYAYFCKKKSFEYISECSDEFICLKKTENYSSVSACFKENFETNFVLDIKDEINSVLTHSCCMAAKNVEIKQDSIVVSGEIETNVVYVSTEGSELKTLCETIKFSEELPNNSLTEGGEFETLISITNNKFNINGNSIEFSINAKCEIIETKQSEISTIIDAFSLNNDVNISFENANINYLANKEQVEEKIYANVNLSEKNIMLNKVVGVANKNLLVSNIITEDNFVICEGLVNLTVFYETNKDDDENEKNILSVDVEIPFSVKTFVNGINVGDQVYVSACLGDGSARHKRTNEIDVYALLKLNICCYKNDNVVLTKSVELGDDKIPNDVSISLYVTKQNDKPFDICKIFSMPNEQILKFNKELSEYFEKDETLPEGLTIVVYRQKQTKMA